MDIEQFKSGFTRITKVEVAKFATQFPKEYKKLVAKQNRLRTKAGLRIFGRLTAQSLYNHLFTDKPKCINCGKPTKWRLAGRYSEFCSNACVNSSEVTVARRRETGFKRFGMEPNLHPSIQAKKKQAFIENYGVDNPSKCEAVKQKKEATSLKNFGVKHWVQQEGAITTFNSDNPMKYEETKEKIRKTSLAKYGTENPSQSKVVKQKIVATNMRRYGVSNGGLIHGFKRKTCVDKFGVKHIVQGFEPKAIEWLSKRKEVVAIHSKREKIPSIKYKINGSRKNYYPDIIAELASGSKRIIEVKGSWPLRVCFEQNVAKFLYAAKYAERHGYTFWLFYFKDSGELTKIESPTRADLEKLIVRRPRK